VATLFGPGDDGTPTATDWADAIGTINYEIVTRFGSSRVPRVYDGTAGVPTPDAAAPNPTASNPPLQDTPASGAAGSGVVAAGVAGSGVAGSGDVAVDGVVRGPGAPGAVASAEEGA
jgi:alanine racemase